MIEICLLYLIFYFLTVWHTSAYHPSFGNNCRMLSSDLQGEGTYFLLKYTFSFVIINILFLQAEEETKNILKSTIAKYYTQSTENGDAITVAWDSLQVSLHCCGVDNYTDYQNNDAWAKGDKIIPESCCVLDEATLAPLAPTCTTSPNDVNSYYKKVTR